MSYYNLELYICLHITKVTILFNTKAITCKSDIYLFVFQNSFKIDIIGCFPAMQNSEKVVKFI